MIIDLTQSNLIKQMDLRAHFSNPFNLAEALVFAKAVLPDEGYEYIKKELMKLAQIPEPRIHI